MSDFKDTLERAEKLNKAIEQLYDTQGYGDIRDLMRYAEALFNRFCPFRTGDSAVFNCDLGQNSIIKKGTKVTIEEIDYFDNEFHYWISIEGKWYIALEKELDKA